MEKILYSEWYFAGHYVKMIFFLADIPVWVLDDNPI
jgi:hypothetical protein